MRHIETYHGFGIYERSDKEIRRGINERDCILSRYEVYLPGESPDTLDAAEWDTDNLQECRDFIDSYEE